MYIVPHPIGVNYHMVRLLAVNMKKSVVVVVLAALGQWESVERQWL